MTKRIKKQREITIKKWQEQYKNEIKSCLDEAELFATNHPYAKKCIIRRKIRSEQFRIALIEACDKRKMGVVFGWFGKIEIWFNIIELEARYW